VTRFELEIIDLRQSMCVPFTSHSLPRHLSPRTRENSASELIARLAYLCDRAPRLRFVTPLWHINTARCVKQITFCRNLVGDLWDRDIKFAR
jgi:hypothetical protein